MKGAERTRGGAKNLIILREKERETFDNRSLSKPQLTVLFFVNAMHFLIRFEAYERLKFSLMK